MQFRLGRIKFKICNVKRRHIMDGYKTVYETGDFEFHIIISYIISILMIAAFTYVVVNKIK